MRLPFVNIGFLVDGSELNSVQWTMNARITALDVGGFGQGCVQIYR